MESDGLSGRLGAGLKPIRQLVGGCPDALLLAAFAPVAGDMHRFPRKLHRFGGTCIGFVHAARVGRQGRRDRDYGLDRSAHSVIFRRLVRMVAQRFKAGQRGGERLAK